MSRARVLRPSRRLLPLLAMWIAGCIDGGQPQDGPRGEPVAAVDPAPAVVPSMYIVTFKSGVSPDAAAGRLRSRGRRVRHVYRHVLSGVAMELDAAQLTELMADPSVASIEPDAIMHATAEQASPTWGLDRIDQRALPLAGSYAFPDQPGAGVKVYVVDTGVLSTHAEFANRVQQGASFVTDGPATGDCNGHGTHVAGTIAGATYGIAKAATIVPIRVLDCFGSGATSAIVQGLDQIVAMNAGAAAVVNMSLGGAKNAALDSAVQRVVAAGIPVVVAAGNSAKNDCLTGSPGGVLEAITVGATALDDSQAYYSNFGSCVDLYAPGSAITSAGIASNTAVAVLTGTSMATPHVAGAVAVLRAQQPALTPAQLATAVVANATTGRISGLGLGSPNLLLHAPPPASAVAAALTIPTTSLANVVAVAPVDAALPSKVYRQAVAVSGGSPPYTLTVTAGALPTGLTLNATTGVISGVPTVVGTAAFTVRATDSVGAAATQALGISTLAPLAYSVGATPPAGRVGSGYSYTFAKTGGVAPFTWFTYAGFLPPGLTLDPSTGAVTGTPTLAGSYYFGIAVNDAAGGSGGEGSVNIVVNDGAVPGLAVSTISLAGATTGSGYSQALAAAGGTAPYTWSIAAGALPAGLTLSAATGVISGTPTAAGTAAFTARVTDAGGAAATKALSLTVSAPIAPLSITTASLPGGFKNISYSQALAATGGVAPYTWAVSVGKLPAGLTLNATSGVISGAPTGTGTSSFTVRVTSAAGTTATKALSLAVTTAVVPGGFNKTAPASNATGRSRTSLALTWGASSNATRYEYCFDTVNDNVCNGTWVSTGTTLSASITGLGSLTSYYWQVRAVSAAGTTTANVSAWWKFTTAP